MIETAILINTRDRQKELNQLLDSLNLQTYKDFDIFILDDSSTPIVKKENLTKTKNKIFLKRSEEHLGVSAARQEIVDFALKKKYRYFCRLDDDVILEQDYLERLINVINQGFDIASGVTPTINCNSNSNVEQDLATWSMKREVFYQNEFLKTKGGRKFSEEELGGHQPATLQKNLTISEKQIPKEPIFKDNIINKAVFNSEGKYTKSNDDCGTIYTKSIILPAHHFRSCALYKSEIHKKINYLPTKLSKHGFREEQIFSYKALMAGFKIAVDIQAIAHHQRSPHGGERFSNEQELREYNQKILEEFIEENKGKLLPLIKKR